MARTGMPPATGSGIEARTAARMMSHSIHQRASTTTTPATQSPASQGSGENGALGISVSRDVATASGRRLHH
jgi:hypothetical protein